jgi:hypothetical protein
VSSTTDRRLGSLDARYETLGDLPAATSVVRADRGDRVSVLDDLGHELLVTLAPPFVSAASYERYESVAKRVPGLDLVVEWAVRRWPVHGTGRWRQQFVDGVERPEADPEAEPDVVLACDWRDLARFLVGGAFIINAQGHVRVEKGGVAEFSCVGGLLWDDTALRRIALPDDVRGLLAEAVLGL